MAAHCDDAAYQAGGAEVLPDAATLWAASDIVLKVRPPTADEVALMRPGTLLIGLIWPAAKPGADGSAAGQAGATVLAIDCLPRTLSGRRKWTRYLHRRASRATAP